MKLLRLSMELLLSVEWTTTIPLLTHALQFFHLGARKNLRKK